MNIYEAALLGAVQGLTEFLPVSSSGHLVLVQHWLGARREMLMFDILVHWGTMLAMFAYFRREITQLTLQSLLFLWKRPRCGEVRETFLRKYPFALTGWLVVLSTLATGIVGLFCKDIFERLFESVLAVGIAWIVMAVFLIASSRIKNLERERTLEQMHHQDAFLIGLAQGVALIPGISRSGSTILTGLWCGLEKRDAARYSFLMGMPAILGVGLLEGRRALDFISQQPQVAAVGFFVSAIVGYLAIMLLMRILQRGKYSLFGYYCLAAGIFAVVTQFIRP